MNRLASLTLTTAIALLLPIHAEALSSAATPLFNPPGWTYASPQTVTISNATPGSIVYYTTDGSTPTTSSSLYTGPITVSSTRTLQAIAVASGYANSAVASAYYGITLAPAATPTISPAGAQYPTPQTVTLSSPTSGAQIYYTTDGSTPTTSSSLYTGPITVSSSRTLQAIAVASGYANSAVASAYYGITLAPAATPTISPAGGAQYPTPQTVTLSSPTSGAQIYYTTDGSTPTTSSSLYTGPITVSSSRTLQAIAVASGYANSAVASAYYGITLAPAATPTISPAGGAQYPTPQTVTLSCPTSGAQIYYTTDGTTPTTSSSLYTGPITVSSTGYINAIATANGSANSAVASAYYAIRLPPAAAPTLSPIAGTYGSPLAIAISNATIGSEIHYTTDGSTPTASSPIFTAPLTISANTTVTAIATGGGYATSPSASATYTIAPQASIPTFGPEAGTYAGSQTVALADATPGAQIRYTTNGTRPTTSSSIYSAPIAVNSTTTINAMATANGYANSAVATATYTIGVVSTPTFNPAAGTYFEPQTVAISDATAGAQIYYTTDGTTPTTNSPLYSAPITVRGGTIKALALANGLSNSVVATATYTLTATSPTITPPGWTYASPQTITLSSPTSGAQIYYTTNGSTPTTSSSLYTAPFSVSAPGPIVNAMAVAAGYTNSAIATANYTISLAPAATPTFAPAAAQYASPQTITLSSPTSGAQIYYTTNGSTPTTSSSLYTAPFSVSAPGPLVKAMAVAAGYANSAIATANYTISLAPAATPTFAPAAAQYASPQTITLSSPTSGAQIYYTTNGSTPTTSSSLYTAPFSVSAPGPLVKAMAVAAGYANSAIATANYTISLAPAATPTFAPAGAQYANPQTVTLSSPTAGAQIYYTTDGSTPTTSSSLYTAPFSVSAPGPLVKAMAVAAGYANSAIATANYTISLAPAATPMLNPQGGTYDVNPFTVTITNLTPGTQIYYTTDGTTPTTQSQKYAGAFAVGSALGGTTTVNAIQVGSGYSNSAVASATYTIPPRAATPVLSPATGTYADALTASLSDETAGAQIHYTTDGSAPTANSTLYSAPISITTNATVKAIATANGYANSAVVTAAYTITTATPIFSPQPGVYPGPQNVTISAATPGAEIYYTIDGTTPTTSSPRYTGPVAITSAVTIHAMAAAPGRAVSGIATGAYSLTSAATDGIAADFSMNSSGDSTQTVTLSTFNANELLVAFVASSGPTNAPQTVTLASSGLAWTLVERANDQPGTAEVWMATAPYPLTEVSVQSVQAVSGYSQSLTVVGFAGAHLTIGATQGASAASGPPSLYLTSLFGGSWIYAIGSDTTRATPRVPGWNQTIAAELIDASGNSDLWMQVVAEPTSAPGVSVAVDDFAPTEDNWNLAAVEVVPDILAPPTFYPSPGTYPVQQAVTLFATAGAQIYYTTDGTTPTVNSTPYSGPILISSTTAIQAIAIGSGFSASSSASATYTITPVDVVLSSIVVSAPSTALPVGSSQQCTATGYFSDGSTSDISRQVQWTSSIPGTATMDAGGSMTALAPGSTTIGATQGAINGSLSIAVMGAPQGQVTTTCYRYDWAGNVKAMLSCVPGRQCACP